MIYTTLDFCFYCIRFCVLGENSRLLFRFQDFCPDMSLLPWKNMNLMDGFSTDGIQLEGYTKQQKKKKKKSLWKKRELFISVSLLIDFSRFFFKLFGKGTVKMNGISQLDEIQFRDLIKGRSGEK
jgi:hypothetical protein